MHIRAILLFVLLCFASPLALGQSPSVLYTWDDTGNPQPNIEAWVRSFGGANTSATLDNATPGVLTLTETSVAPGGTQAFSDGFNRIRESSTAASGGLDLTGLDFLEFDLSHNGAGNVDVQFFVQASVGVTFVSLGPDLSVTPGLNTYSVPLAGLTAPQAVYVRTLGMNVKDHAALGNLTWSVHEIRSGGTPLTQRNLITHDSGTAEGGLQGAIVNFDNAAVGGNNGGQNQTGLAHNASGTGSLQWTDLGGSNGASIGWGNGTAWNGNTFNDRCTDLSNYQTMLVRISATDPLNLGGTIDISAYFQKNGFSFQAAELNALKSLPIDGQFHDLVWSLSGLTDMDLVEITGINLGSHQQDLIINVDLVQFNVPEPSALALLNAASLVLVRPRRRV
jgi:hypothetical protein